MNGNAKGFSNATITSTKKMVDFWFNQSIAAATTGRPPDDFFAQVEPRRSSHTWKRTAKDVFEGATAVLPLVPIASLRMATLLA